MTPSQRYLVYLKYVGSGFRGSQFQNDCLTVQGVVQNALDTFLRIKDWSFKICFSSRTDSGVHAVESAFHFDLPIIFAKPPIFIKIHLNKNFERNRHLVRATEVLKVSDKFNARFSAIEKTYMYRVGILKKSYLDKFEKDRLNVPLTEVDKTYFVRSLSFDVDKAREAGNLFIGEKDFKSFEGVPSKSTCHSICKINSFSIQESQPFCLDLDPCSHMYDYYNFTCSGNRFLRYMVRRLVGTVLAVGKNKITLDDVKHLLENPKNSTLFSKVSVPPGHGLYLLRLVFNHEHLVIPEEEENSKLEQLKNQISINSEQKKLICC